MVWLSEHVAQLILQATEDTRVPLTEEVREILAWMVNDSAAIDDNITGDQVQMVRSAGDHLIITVDRQQLDTTNYVFPLSILGFNDQQYTE